jgi:eukaryotic-like serine/threonine-protein kinase
MSARPTDPIHALILRLLDGDSVDLAALPSALQADPAVKQLAGMSRVAQQLHRNSQTSEAPHVPRELSVGAYRLVQLLGSGGMGDVWLAERSSDGIEQRVAIKFVRSAVGQFARRLHSERRILARLTHPNIGRFLDMGVDARGLPWFAMEYVDGKRITDWCDAHSVGLEQRVAMFIKVCEAVDYAHRQLVVHRDLKPSNILVDGQGEPKLLDFGIAKWLADDERGELTTSVLTPRYAAPEQLRQQAYTTLSDVYSLGLLLFRLLSGSDPASRVSGQLHEVLAQLPREADQLASVTRAQANAGGPISAAQLRGDLDAVVGKALALEPEQRYRSASELAEDLRRHLRGEPVLARPATRWYRFTRLVQRHRLAAGIAAVGVFGMALTTAVAVWQAVDAQTQRQIALVQTAEARAALADAELANTRNEQAKSFLYSVFQRAHPGLAQGADLKAVDLIDGALASVDSSLPNAPQIRAEVRWVLIDAQRTLGRLHPDADALMARSERELRALQPVPVASLIPVLQLQSVLASIQGDYERASDRLKQARQLLPQIADARLQEVQLTYESTLATKQGDMAASLEIAERMLALRRARLGDDHPELAAAHNNVGNNALNLFHTGVAERHLRQAIVLLKQTPNAPPLRLAQVEITLGLCLLAQRRDADGRALMERAVPLMEAALDPNAAQLSIPRVGLWRARALTDPKTAVPPDLSQVARALHADPARLGGFHAAHADALHRSGQPQAAERALDASIAAYRAAPPNHYIKLRIATLGALKASRLETTATDARIAALQSFLTELPATTNYIRQQHIVLLERLAELAESAHRPDLAKRAMDQLAAMVKLQRAL